MIIRKIKKNGIVSTRKLIKRAILLVAIFLVIKGIAHLLQGQTNRTGISVAQIGEEVTIQGYLSPENKFPYYTHSIIDVTKNKIGIKSASVNLNEYSGQVEIIGKVEKFLKLTPIIEVTAIKLPSQRVIIKNNTYLFVDDFFLLDFSTQPQLSATKSGEAIVVLFDDKPVVEINRFVCNRILKGRNCMALVNDYVKNDKDNFYSLRGYNFYKHTDGIWIVFEGDIFGYVFKNIDDDMMLNLSNMVKLIDENFIMVNKKEQLKEICGLNSIASSELKYSSNGIITVTVSGKTKEKNTIDCSVAFDPRTQWSAKKVFLEK